MGGYRDTVQFGGCETHFELNTSASTGAPGELLEYLVVWRLVIPAARGGRAEGCRPVANCEDSLGNPITRQCPFAVLLCFLSIFSGFHMSSLISMDFRRLL
jgi:hypothetical protein